VAAAFASSRAAPAARAAGSAAATELGVICPQLRSDLDRPSGRAIRMDVVFTQGKTLPGLP
jgi:hypothetical protein